MTSSCALLVNIPSIRFKLCQDCFFVRRIFFSNSSKMVTITPLTAEDTTGLNPNETEVFIPWDNPHNIISFETFLAFENVMTCGVSLILFLIGVPTNLLNCLVFYRQGLRDRMNLCLFSLALADMLFVTFFYVICSFCLVGQLRPELEEWWKYFARKYFTGLFRGFLYTSGLLTMLIAVERCVCVTLPLKAATLVKTRTIAVIIVSIVLSIQVVCLLYPLELSIGTMEDPDTGKITLFLTTTEFRSQYILLYNIVENTLVMIVIPFTTFIVVTVATAITVVQLKRAIAWRHGSSSTSSSDVREVALVKMLVVVSLIYIISSAPNVAPGDDQTAGARVCCQSHIRQHFPGFPSLVLDTWPAEQFCQLLRLPGQVFQIQTGTAQAA